MNVLLGESIACAVIKGPWNFPSERKDLYARVSSSIISPKRHRGKSPRKGHSCVIQATVWTPATERNGFNTRSFKKVHSNECILQDWNDARLLGIFDALDEELLVEFSWLLVAVSRKVGKYGIALLQFTQRGLILVDVFEVCGAALQAVALRGPVVLYCTSSVVRLVGRDGDIQLDSRLELFSSSQPLARYLVCDTGHDLHGIVAVIEKQQNSHECISVRKLHASGKYEREWILRDVQKDKVRLIVTSIRQGMVALAEVDGTLKMFELDSGRQLWKTWPREELENPSSLFFGRDMLVATSGSTTAIWAVSLLPSSHANQHVRSVIMIFPTHCTTISPQTHGHFLAPWREYLLLCNDLDGTHCADFRLSPEDFRVDSDQLQGSYLCTVINNLERRLDAGVERVVDVAERVEDMLRMLGHVSSLVTRATRKKAETRRLQLFNGQLEKVLSLTDRPEPMRDISKGENETEQSLLIRDSSSEKNRATKASLSSKVLVDGCVPGHDGANFVRLISSKTGVDQSSRFIVVRVHLLVLRVANENDTSSGARTLQLNVDFDRCMAAVWDVERKTGLKPGKECWLGACAPISTLLTNNAYALSDLSIIVRVDAGGYGSQALGRFSLSRVLSSTLKLKSLSKSGNELLGFERKVHAIAQGRSAHELLRLSNRVDIAKELWIETRENLAYLNFSFTSIAELALAIAKLRSFVDDEVQLRSTQELSPIALRGLDSSLRGLGDEMRAIRRLMAQPRAIGYDVHEVRRLLKIQIDVDESIGVVEEQFLGS